MSCWKDGIHCPKMYRIMPVKLVPKMANSATPDLLLGRLLFHSMSTVSNF